MVEMLLENPFLIIILIGIISSLFSSSKKQEPERQERPKEAPQQKNQRPVKDFRDIFDIPELQDMFGLEKEEPAEEESRKQAPLQSEPVTRSQQAQSTTHNDRQSKMLRQAAEIERLRQTESQLRLSAIEIGSEEIGSGLEKSATSKSTASLPTTGKRLIDGVIFAEIIGQPRAKNPHQSRRF